MDQAAIVPLAGAGGLDMFGGATGAGLTLEQAELTNCAATLLTPRTAAWGASQELTAAFDPDSHLLYSLTLSDGYTGQLVFRDRTGAHTYVIALNQPITKDGVPFLIPWSSWSTLPDGGTNVNAAATELYNALMGPNGPGAALSDAFVDVANCNIGLCTLIGNDGFGSAHLVISELGLNLYFPENVPNPAASTPYLISLQVKHTEPYASLAFDFKLDGVGPTAQGQLLDGGAPCNLQTGMQWGDLLADCVQTSSSSVANARNLLALTGGETHDLERWRFVADRASPIVAHSGGTVTGSMSPSSTDLVVGFETRTPLHVLKTLNDFTGNVRDLHGSGLLARELLRLLQMDVQRLRGLGSGFPIGASACMGPSPAVGCTGLEGVLLPGLPYGDPYDSNIDALGYYFLPWVGGPLPIPQIAWCTDATTTQVDCTQGPIFTTLRDRVVSVAGVGFPPELADPSYYMRWYANALVRYLKAYGIYGASLIPAQVTAIPFCSSSPSAASCVDLERASYDLTSTGGVYVFSYIDPSFATALNPAPLTFQLVLDPNGTGYQNVKWFRGLESSETNVLTATSPDKTYLLAGTFSPTGLFGSPALANVWPQQACALDGGGPNCNQAAATDWDGGTVWNANGDHALLEDYPGAWGPSVLGRDTSYLTIQSLDPDSGTASISIPNPATPFTPVPLATPTLSMVVPYHADAPLTVPVGQPATWRTFSLSSFLLGPTMGQLEVFVRPSGTLAAGQTVTVKAIRERGFVGATFPCVAVSTSGLVFNPFVVHVGDPASGLQAWVANNPAVATGCRFQSTPDAGTPTAFFSTLNGVLLNVGPDGERVVEAVLYDPML